MSNKYPHYHDKIISMQSVHTYNTRSSQLRIPYCRINTTKQCVIYQCTRLWNILPTYLKEKNSVPSFKYACKKYYVDQY